MKSLKKKIDMKSLKKKRELLISVRVVIHVAEEIWSSKNVVTSPNAAGMSILNRSCIMYHRLVTTNTACILHIRICIQV